MRNTQNIVKTIKNSSSSQNNKILQRRKQEKHAQEIFLFEEQQQHGKYNVIKPNLFSKHSKPVFQFSHF